MRAGRTLLLDAVRGLAVVAVVAYHCFTLAVVEPHPEGTVGPGWWQPLSVLVHPLAGVLIAALLVRAVTAGRTAGAGVSALGAVGVVSFSLYLWHCPVLHHGLRLLGLDQAGMPAVAVVAGLVVLVAVSGALALLSYRLVERPFLERKGAGRRGAPAETEKALAGQAA